MPVFASTKSWLVRLILLVLVAIATNAQTTNPPATSGAATETWKELLAAKESFYKSGPGSLEQKEFDRFLKDSAEKAGILADRFKDYQIHHPGSTNVAKAWEEWMNLMDIAANGSTVRRAELEKVEQERLADPKLTSRQRSRIRYNQLGRINDGGKREQMVRELKNEMERPTDFFCQQMLQIAEHSDYPRSLEIVAEVLKLTESPPTIEEYRATGHTSTNERALKNWQAMEKSYRDMHRGTALELQKRLERIGKPLALQFTAFDGTKIDLEQYRGKVVLLDFWATWCPPCVAGLPGVKSVWTKYRQNGFEVIGISYDEDRGKLERFLKKHDFAWPQFFDPAGKAAVLVQSLGQPGPPAYWLIDRQGNVADINAHEDLEKKVKRLLDLKEPQAKPVSTD